MIIRTVNLSKVYANMDVETVALRHIYLQIQEGDFVSIMGPSGCGKSTLLNLMGLLDEPTDGEIYFMGEEVSRISSSKKAFLRRKHIGFVFQNFNLIDDLTLYENIELPLIYQGVPASERKKRVMELMERLQIAHKQRFFPQQVSGGQQQRAAVARAVITKPDLILADEPTGNLDSIRGQEVMEMLLNLHKEGTTIVMVTHSSTAAAYSQRTIHLFDGQIVTENLLR